MGLVSQGLAVSRKKVDLALQSFFHYEPYPDFHARVNAAIQAQIKEWQTKKLKKVT
ncbi:hypothetical protein QQ045_033017 [Rhodiola kirilowii]